MKIDLHLHSKYSKRPTHWILQKIGCPESFSEPEDLYKQAQHLSLSALTLTDHNTIAGCLEIAHRSMVFISEEITTYFPEDRCKVHVLAFDINEAIHRDIQKARENIYDLVAYLREKNIVHALAHPLQSVNNMLSISHFEKFLLLFNIFELNGARDHIQNHILSGVLERLEPELIESLMEKHQIIPVFADPWRKNIIGGSDDHSCLGLARMYTEVMGATSIKEFLRGIETHRARALGQGSNPRAMARDLYSLAYQFYDRRFKLSRFSDRDLLVRFLERFLKPDPERGRGMLIRVSGLFRQRRLSRLADSHKVEDLLRLESERLILNDPELLRVIHGSDGQGLAKEARWFRFVNQVTNKALLHFFDHLITQLRGINLFNIFTTIGAAGSMFFFIAPYFIAFSLFGRGRLLSQRILGRLDRLVGQEGRIKVAHFTDTFYEVNGVAITLQQQAKVAAATGKDLTIVTCAEDEAKLPCVHHFTPLSVRELPYYPEMKLFLPPFLQMLDYVYENNFTHLHSATPGPLGLGALAIAKILKLPISATYHTALPQYASRLSGDETLEAMAWRYALWYYNQMDAVYVPSKQTAEELQAKGLSKSKIRLYPRGVDTVRFHPDKASDFFRRYGIDEAFKLLYVGRVSKEKNLPFLVEVFKALSARGRNIHLIVCGDGPYRAEMEKALVGWPATFVGYLFDGDLETAFASSDAFIFPSTTDTFGNVILEAQASGLPVIVSDTGGPQENLVPGQTGLVVGADDLEGFCEAVLSLADNPILLKRMSRAARAYAENHSFERAFEKHWQMYSEPAVTKDSPTAGNEFDHLATIFQAGLEPLMATPDDEEDRRSKAS